MNQRRSTKAVQRGAAAQPVASARSAAPLAKRPDLSIQLAEEAGPRVFQRGQEYYQRGQVLNAEFQAEAATALVLGTQPYRVRLQYTGAHLVAACDCPAAQTRAVCKHAVALGLAWAQPALTPGQTCTAWLEQALNALCAPQPELSGAWWRDQLEAALAQGLAAGAAQTLAQQLDKGLRQLAEMHTAPQVPVTEVCALAELLSVYHLQVHRQLTASPVALARAVFRWELAVIAAGAPLGIAGASLVAHYTAKLGPDWRAAYATFAERAQAKLACRPDQQLSLAQRRWRNWLTARQASEFLNAVPRAADLPDAAPLVPDAPADLIAARLRQLLAAGDVAAAWDLAQREECSDELWLRLALARGRRAPAEALPVLQRLLKRALARKDGYSAQHAVRLLRVVRRLFRRLGQEAEFVAYVDALLLRYGQQRGFRRWRGAVQKLISPASTSKARASRSQPAE
jgi:hypothetical protein